MIAFVAVSGACVFHSVAVFAASGIVSQETPLHDSADPDASVIALLPEGTIVSIDGPPVDGFYPVTAGDGSGWMRGETVSVDKDIVEDEANSSPPPADPDGSVPVQQTADGDAAPVETPTIVDAAA